MGLSSLDSDSPEGFTALAAHVGHCDVMRLLIDRGAAVNLVATHRLAVTPLHAALFGRQVDAARRVTTSFGTPFCTAVNIAIGM